MELLSEGAIPKKPADPFFKNVLLLKNGNFQRIDGQVRMPTASEIATIKTKAQLGQFGRKVEFFASMSEDMVKKKLEETFPYLNNRRFSCAAVVKLDKDSSRFEFYGTPCLWDGKTIKSKIKGNSALYILEDEAPKERETELNSASTPQGNDDAMDCIATNVDQTSILDDSEMEIDDQQVTVEAENLTVQTGNSNTHQDQLQISDDSEDNASTSGFSEEELSLVRWLQETFDYEVSINPTESPLKGGAPCCFTFKPELQPEVTSGRATFGNLGVVELLRPAKGFLLGTSIPASPMPGWVTVIIESQDGIRLGQTEIYYKDQVEDVLQQIVVRPELQKRLFDKYNGYHSWSGSLEISGGGSQNSGTLGCQHPVQMLGLLVYAAAESGAQQFIEMIFTSSAGRIVFDAYKDRSVLPEVIAKVHGHVDTANYLEDITKRFSVEIRADTESSQTIDWSELSKAAEAAQKQHDTTGEEEKYQLHSHVPKETGYLADVDTSSGDGDSSESQSSDSEDDISLTSGKEVRTETAKWIQPDWVYAMKAKKANLSQNAILFLSGGEFQEKKVDDKIKPLNQEQTRLIKDHLIRETDKLRQLSSLHRSGISFLLGFGNEPIHYYLTTAYQKLANLLKVAKERNAYWQMHTDQRLSGNSSTMAAENYFLVPSSMISLLQIEGPEPQFDCFAGDTTMPSDKNLTARMSSLECSKEHRFSPTSDVWVLTYRFRPTRKILFVYIADTREVFLRDLCFDNKEYEILTQCLQWPLCRNNSTIVNERLKETGDFSDLEKLALPPLNSHITDVSKEVCKEQSHPGDRQPYDSARKQFSADISSVPKSMQVGRNSIDLPNDLNEIKWLVSEKCLQIQSADYVDLQSEDSSDSLARGTSLTLTFNNSGDDEINGDWATGLGDGLARNKSLTTLNLTINNSGDLYRRGDWVKGLGDGLARNTSLTTLNLTINNSSDLRMSGNWAKGLGDGLAKNTSLTVLDLTINNSSDLWMSGNWIKGLGDGLAGNTSLTTLNLTINNSSDLGMSENWIKGLGDGLAGNTSLTTLNLTINDSSDLWEKGLGDGLAKNTSLTTLNLTINNSSDHRMRGDWATGLGDGLARNKSLTTLNLIINNSSDYRMRGDWATGLGGSLEKNTSLTTLNLPILNSRSYYRMRGDWAKVLGDGLATNTSLTTLDLTINITSYYAMSGDWAEKLVKRLTGNTSLTPISLTVNNSFKISMNEEWVKELEEFFEKNTSFATLSFTFNKDSFASGVWSKGSYDALAKSTSLTTRNLRIAISDDSYMHKVLDRKFGVVADDLDLGLEWPTMDEHL